VRAIEGGGSPEALWSAIADAGFLELLSSEDAGGAGLALADLFPILHALGRYTVPLPVGESMAARALLPAGEVPEGRITLAAAVRRTHDGGWLCPGVPFGALADHVVADDGENLLLFSCAQARVQPSGVAFGLSASLTFPETSAPARYPRHGDDARAFGAALYASMLSGALGQAFEVTLQYGNDRSQFGKAIGKFQAIQHQLAVMAELVAASRMAAEAAFQGDGAAPTLMAKSRTSEAVTTCASVSHAVHGAIGVTQEYDLQLYTRRMHEWRLAHGSEQHWNAVIGRAVLDSGQSISDFVRAVAH
jgi:acyl-CoA dehydrogenase